MSVCLFLRKVVFPLKFYWYESLPKVLFILQVVYKSEPAGSDNYVL